MNPHTAQPAPAPQADSTFSAPNTDAGRHTRWGWWIVLAGVGGFMAWALLAPLDQGVPVSGTVTVAGNKKAVQHLSGGTVDTIWVKEGDTVAAGQPLVGMNAVQAQANADITRGQCHTARLTEARLVAERDGRREIAFGDDLLQAVQGDVRLSAALAVQQQLFLSRRLSLQAELAALDESVAGIQALNTGLQEAHAGKRQQLGFLQDQLAGMRDLAREGYVPRNRLLELERTHAQLSASLAEDLGGMARGQRQIGEFKLRRQQRQQEFQMEVRTQLAEVQKEADALRNRLVGLEHELANVVVKAPVDGIVADLNVFTEGGVVAPGFRMMDIVPLTEPLVVEGQVPVHLIDSVRPQLPVELIFSAFNQNTTPRIPAVVTQVSADRLVDEQTGTPYYRMRAVLTAEGQRLVAALPLRPGMPVDLFVKTGERTLANYLSRPVRDNLRMALTEE